MNRNDLVAHILKRVSPAQITLLCQLPADGSPGEVSGTRPQVTAATLRELEIASDVLVRLVMQVEAPWPGEKHWRTRPERWRLTGLGKAVRARLPAGGSMMDVAKLRKVHGLTTSPNPHEAAAAWGRVDAMLWAEGKTRRELPGLLKEAEPAKPAQGAGFNPFAGFDDFMEKKEPGYRARAARERAERRQREKDELAALLQRYGGLAGLEADNAMQAAVEAAAASFKSKVQHQFANGVFEVDGLDGWYDSLWIDRAPERVKAAIARAIPLPATITEAKAEHDAWEARDRELGLAWDRLDDNQLSLPCRIRQDMVRRLYERDLRARTLEEVLARQRHFIALEYADPDHEKAILADLEVLAAREATPRPAGTIPPEVDGLDAPRSMPPEQRIGWARGWNACRAAMMEGAARG